MRIADVYRPTLLTCDATDGLAAVARKMTAEEVGALAVVDGTRVVGVISERDITKAVAHETDLPAVPAARYMTEHLEVATVEADTRDVARLMLNAGVRHLPVVSGYTLIGMVSVRDLLTVETWAA